MLLYSMLFNSVKADYDYLCQHNIAQVEDCDYDAYLCTLSKHVSHKPASTK
jgi:hypothetical protein